MGLYDTLYDWDLRCVYCRGGNRLNVQTKELGRHMSTWYVHQPKNCSCSNFRSGHEHTSLPKKDRIRSIIALVSCHSPLCASVTAMEDLTNLGYVSGSGTTFHVRYPVDSRGRVCGPAKVTEKYPWNPLKTRNAFLRTLEGNPVMAKEFTKVVDRCYGDNGIAVLHFTFDAQTSG